MIPRDFGSLEREKMVESGDRLSQGRTRWHALVADGGIWPASTLSPPAAGMFEGVGEYEPGSFHEILADVLPKAPADRVWPWVARATWIYACDRAVAEAFGPSELSAAAIIERIAQQAVKLAANLTDLSAMAMASPDRFGQRNVSDAKETLNKSALQGR